MHWQFSRVFKNPIYPRKFTDVTKLTDFTTLQTYRRCTTFRSTRVVQFQSLGPPARARGLQHEALRRGGSATSIRSHAHTREEGWGGGAYEIVAATRAHCFGGACCTVVQKCCQLVAAMQVCGVVGRRGHAHARMQRSIALMTKSAYFRRQFRRCGLEP